MRVTRLRADDGTVWYVPNGEIRKLANSSRGWAQATVDVPVPVAADIDTVLDAVRAAADAVSRRSPLRPACVSTHLGSGESWPPAADTFTCRVSVRTSTTEREHLARILREEIGRRLQAAGVFVHRPYRASPPGTPAPAADV